MYEFLSNFYPKKIKENYMKLLTYSKISFRPERFLGFVLFFGFGLALGFSLMFARLFNIPLILFDKNKYANWIALPFKNSLKANIR